MLHYKKNEESDKTSQDCPICYEAIDAGCEKVLKCKHVFHKECIEKWLSTKSTCPICRKPIKKTRQQRGPVYFEDYVDYVRRVNHPDYVLGDGFLIIGEMLDNIRL